MTMTMTWNISTLKFSVNQYSRNFLFLDYSASSSSAPPSPGVNGEASLLTLLPRTYQLWDLDAFRNDFVQEELWGVPLKDPSRAIFAAYLALLIKGELGSKEGWKDTYFDYLPSQEDYEAYHPVMKDEETLKKYLGDYTHAYLWITDKKKNIQEEYDSFVKESPKFASLVTSQEYMTARLHVTTRCFSTGSPDDLDTLDGQLSVDELKGYRSTLGADYGRDGFLVLMPLIDSLNHHRDANTVFHYHAPSQRFGLATTQPVQKGKEFFVSYGEKHESW